MTTTSPGVAAPSSSLDSQETNGTSRALDLFGDPLPLPRQPKPLRLKDQPGYDPDVCTWSVARKLFSAGVYGPWDVRPADRIETVFRHSGWSVTREKVRRALMDVATNPSRLERFDHCGSGCMVERCSVSGKVRTVSNHCHDRFCKPCGDARSKLIATNLGNHVRERETRFLTLTLRHNEHRLVSQVERLYTCFRRLRASPFWKSHVEGGAAFLEIKLAKDGRTWHPHIHIIAEGSFINQRLLSEKWLEITGDSWIVDVRYVRDKGEVIKYVAKYASKPLDATLFRSHEHLKEAMVALKGRRLCLTFGGWRGLELEKRPEDTGEWKVIASLVTVERCARLGEEWALGLLRALNAEDVLNEPRPRPPDGT
jgi:hypothetical protein